VLASTAKNGAPPAVQNRARGTGRKEAILRKKKREEMAGKASEKRTRERRKEVGPRANGETKHWILYSPKEAPKVARRREAASGEQKRPAPAPEASPQQKRESNSERNGPLFKRRMCDLRRRRSTGQRQRRGPFQTGERRDERSHETNARPPEWKGWSIETDAPLNCKKSKQKTLGKACKTKA